MTAGGRSARYTVALLGMMCALPFLQPRHTYPITSFYSEWLAVALGVAALVPLCAGSRGSSIRVPRIALMPMALASVVLLQCMLLDMPYFQPLLLAVAYLVWAVLVMIAAVAARDAIGAERMVVALAAFVLGGAVVNASIALVQYYVPPGALEPFIATRLGLPVYGNLGQPNHFADQITLGLASLASLYALKRVRLGLACAVCGPMLFALALSGSRGAWLYLCVLIGTAALAHRASGSDDTRRAVVFALSLLPAFAIAHGVATLVAFQPSTTALGRWLELWAAPSDRLQLWQEAWLMFLRSPWIGIGWGQFAWQHFMFDAGSAKAQLTGLYSNAHNGLLHLLAETGLIGASVTAGGIGLWLAASRKALCTATGWWVAAVLAILAVHSMLEYPLWNAYFLGIAALMLGLGESRYVATLPASTAGRISAVIPCLAVVVLANVIIDYLRLERIFAAPSAMDEPMKSWLLQPYVDLFEMRTMTLDTEDIEHKLTVSGRIIRYMPTGIVAYRRSLLLALVGNSDESRDVVSRAASHYPMMLREYATQLEAQETGNVEAQRAYLEVLDGLILRQNTAASAPER